MQVKAEPKANSNWKEFKFWIFFFILLKSWLLLFVLCHIVTSQCSCHSAPFICLVTLFFLPRQGFFTLRSICFSTSKTFFAGVFFVCVLVCSNVNFCFLVFFDCGRTTKKEHNFFFFLKMDVVSKVLFEWWHGCHLCKRRHFEANLASSACCNCFYPEVKWPLSADWTEVTLSCARLHLAAVCSYCDATATKWNWYISLYITYLIFNMRTLEYQVGFFTTQILW